MRMNGTSYKPFLLCLAIAAAGAGCGDDAGTGDLGGGPPDMTMTGGDGGNTNCATPAADPTGCKPLMTDYQPRANMSQDDSWPACISDDNSYHLVGMAVPGSASRVTAWEGIGARLWRNLKAPTGDDFLQARADYSVPNGIGSRVERRQDIHYGEIPNNNKTRCSEAGIPEMYPDRCVGPARLVPLINDAFVKGIAGDKPLVQAARIEFGLLWFFYVSTLSEQWTCYYEALDDCDGVWSHYNAAQPRDSRIGLVNAANPRRSAKSPPFTQGSAANSALSARGLRSESLLRISKNSFSRAPKSEPSSRVFSRMNC